MLGRQLLMLIRMFAGAALLAELDSFITHGSMRALEITWGVSHHVNIVSSVCRSSVAAFALSSILDNHNLIPE